MNRQRQKRPPDEQPARSSPEDPAERSSAPRDDEPLPPQFGEDPGTLDSEAERT